MLLGVVSVRARGEIRACIEGSEGCDPSFAPWGYLQQSLWQSWQCQYRHLPHRQTLWDQRTVRSCVLLWVTASQTPTHTTATTAWRPLDRSGPVISHSYQDTIRRGRSRTRLPTTRKDQAIHRVQGMGTRIGHPSGQHRLPRSPVANRSGWSGTRCSTPTKAVHLCRYGRVSDVRRSRVEVAVSSSMEAAAAFPDARWA